MLHSLYICDHKKIFVLLPAEDFMNNMIFDLKQSFGPLSQAKGRLLSQREIWYFTPLVSFRGKKIEHKPQGMMMMMMMTFNVICDTWVLLLMLISCSVEWQGLGTLEKCSPLRGKGLYSFSQY